VPVLCVDLDVPPGQPMCQDSAEHA
jgi:hypothetical protein